MWCTSVVKFGGDAVRTIEVTLSEDLYGYVMVRS